MIAAIPEHMDWPRSVTTLWDQSLIAWPNELANIVERWLDLAIRQRRNDGRLVEHRSIRIVRLGHA